MSKVASRPSSQNSTPLQSAHPTPRQSPRIDADASTFPPITPFHLTPCPDTITAEEKVSRLGMVGLANLGNTCYANSALQAIRHQSDLTIYLFQNKHEDILKAKRNGGGHQGTLVRAYNALNNDLWKLNPPSFVRPTGFWDAMLESAKKTGFEQFRYRAPHDSQEFLMFLLDQIHEGLKEEVMMTISPKYRPPIVEESLRQWKQLFEKQYSPLVELLFTLQLYKTECGTCATVSRRWETNNMLKVCVPFEEKAPTEGPAAEPPAYTLTEMLQAEAKDETIEGYQCDTCMKSDPAARTVATRRHFFWRLGNWVILTLKRNQNNGRRVNTRVNIPLTQNFGELFDSESTEASRTGNYDLFAVINHHGGATGGHYTSQCRNPLTGEWNLFDDETVHQLPKGPHLDASAYILMYRLCVK
jgi:ubiquitin C-terminal hydrolase